MSSMSSGILWAVPTEAFPAAPHLRGDVVEHCHHVTLGMGALDGNWPDAIGTAFEAEVLGVAWSETIGVEALVVKLPADILQLVRTTKQQEKLGGFKAHLTLFTREGVKPFTSNAMLAGEHQMAGAAIATLRLRVAFCPNDQVAEEVKTSYRQTAA